MGRTDDDSDGGGWTAPRFRRECCITTRCGKPSLPRPSPAIQKSCPPPARRSRIRLTVSHAIPMQFRAIGLPSGLYLNPQSGLISGEVDGPARRSIQIQVDTNRGRLSQVLWLNVFSGLPPTDISLDPAVVKENSYDGSVVGTLTATDPDGGTMFTSNWFQAAGGGQPQIRPFRESVGGEWEDRSRLRGGSFEFQHPRAGEGCLVESISRR